MIPDFDMRGDERRQPDLFLHGTLSKCIPESHPLRPVREMTDMALEPRSARFDELYATNGRPSISPELLRPLMLEVPYLVRSDRMLVEHPEYKLLFRWFVGYGMNDRAWNHALFSKNRERLLAGAVAEEFLACVVGQAGDASARGGAHHRRRHADRGLGVAQ